MLVCYPELYQYIKFIREHYLPGTWEAFSSRQGYFQNKSLETIIKEFTDQGLDYQSGLLRDDLAAVFDAFILPKLRESDLPSILSLPCSTGQELFSLGILALEKDIGYVKLEGRDVSGRCINEAASGEFWAHGEDRKTAREFIEKRYFQKQFSGRYKVADYLLKMCDFYVHDILQFAVMEPPDVTICRNLLMHLSEEGRSVALRNITVMMSEGNLLVLDKPYYTPQCSELTYRENKLFASRIEYNNFIAGLEEQKEFGLKKIHPNYNVYEKC